jgi:hypothetical protein
LSFSNISARESGFWKYQISIISPSELLGDDMRYKMAAAGLVMKRRFSWEL